jgi:ribosome-binding factor A
MADKKGRIAQIIQRNLSEIIIYQLESKITDFASITEVRVSDDYSYCKVFVAHVESDKIDSLVKYLNANAGKIRTLLSKKLDIYKTPALSFVKDDTFDKGHYIDDLIDNAINNKPKTLADLEDKK